MSFQPGSGGGMSGSGRDRKKKEIAQNIIPKPLATSSDGDGEYRDEPASVDGGEPNRQRPLDSLVAALEAALPIKRGLSRFFNGRSKSFSNLGELGVEDVRDLGKKEHLINKRRRLLLANEFYENGEGSAPLDGPAIAHTASMPIFLVDSIDEGEESNKYGGGGRGSRGEDGGK